jgi:hypothetical protein
MGFFDKGPKPPAIPPTLTQELAQEIYNKLMEHVYGDANITLLFTEDGYSINHCEQVIEEAKRLEREAIEHCQNNEVVTIITISLALEPDLLDLGAVGADILKFNPTYDPDRTFQEFRDAYPYIPPPEPPEPEVD